MNSNQLPFRDCKISHCCSCTSGGKLSSDTQASQHLFMRFSVCSSLGGMVCTVQHFTQAPVTSFRALQCGPACACSPDCPLRTTQNGLAVKLQLVSSCKVGAEHSTKRKRAMLLGCKQACSNACQHSAACISSGIM